MKTVLFKFAGPLQTWGSGSHFETRHTDLYPTKSAVLGLIASSLGFNRDETDEIRKLNQLDFAVRVDQVGGLLRDYQTVKKYKEDGSLKRTYVTNRYYLEDAVILSAISHKDDAWMDRIVAALAKPRFQPYLGRRSCPPNMDYVAGVFENDMNVVDFLTEYPWQASYWYQKKHKNDRFFLEIYADSHLMEKDDYYITRRDKVISFSQKRREFGFRRESRKLVKPIIAPPSEEASDGNYGGKSSIHDFWDAVVD